MFRGPVIPGTSHLCVIGCTLIHARAFGQGNRLKKCAKIVGGAEAVVILRFGLRRTQMDAVAADFGALGEAVVSCPISRIWRTRASAARSFVRSTWCFYGCCPECRRGRKPSSISPASAATSSISCAGSGVFATGWFRTIIWAMFSPRSRRRRSDDLTQSCASHLPRR